MTRVDAREAMMSRVVFGAHPDWETTALAAVRDPDRSGLCRWALVRAPAVRRSAGETRLVRPRGRGGTLIEELEPGEVPAGWCAVEVEGRLNLPAPTARPRVPLVVRFWQGVAGFLFVGLPLAGLVGAAVLERFGWP